MRPRFPVVIEVSCWQSFAHRATLKVIRIQICEVGVGRFVLIIWNEWIIRLDVSVTHDAYFDANRILDKKELFAVGKQV